jgi:hypothetical protein
MEMLKMSLSKKSGLSVFALGVAMLSAATVHAGLNPSPLAGKMETMATAMKNIGKAGTPPAAAVPLDDLKILKDVVADCVAHSDDLAPPQVAADPQALQAFKAEFVLLAGKVADLETALNLPADNANRASQVQAAIAAINAVKKDGHAKYKQ